MWMVVVSWLNCCPGGRAFYSPPNNYAKGKSKPVNLHLFARNIQMVYICLFLMVSNCICQYKELLSFRVAIFSITYNGGKRSLASVLLFPYWNKRKATRTPNTVVGCTLARIVHNVVFRFQSKYLEIFCLKTMQKISGHVVRIMVNFLTVLLINKARIPTALDCCV